MRFLIQALRFFGRVVLITILLAVSLLFLVIVPFLALGVMVAIYVAAVKEMWRSSFARLKKSEAHDSLEPVELPRAS